MTHHYILRNDDIKARLIGIIQGLSTSSPWEVEIKPYKSRRSLAQNRLFHAWMQEVAAKYAEAYGEWHAPDVWKVYFKRKFLGEEVSEIKGEQIVSLRKTSKLNMKDMTDLLENVDHYCASELCILLTRPEILYYEAMGQ